MIYFMSYGYIQLNIMYGWGTFDPFTFWKLAMVCHIQYIQLNILINLFLMGSETFSLFTFWEWGIKFNIFNIIYGRRDLRPLRVLKIIWYILINLFVKCSAPKPPCIHKINLCKFKLIFGWLQQPASRTFSIFALWKWCNTINYFFYMAMGPLDPSSFKNAVAHLI